VRDSILLTGATGALGSALLHRLSHEGHEVVCLVRAADSRSAAARIAAIASNKSNVRAIRGNVTEPRCGISADDLESLVGRIDQILHCAASINFQDRQETHLTNVVGVKNILELTDLIAAPRLLHVSTAYVVGDAPYLSEQGLSNGQQWRNPYEESKFMGEKMVQAWAANRADRCFSIFRPSAMIGAEDGTTPTFDGYYRYFAPIHRVAESLRRRQGRSLPPDIVVDDGGMIHVPFALLVADQTINHIPIDWVADMIVAAIDVPSSNQTFNLVHPNPPRIRDCLFWSLDHMKIGGIAVCNSQAEKDVAVRLQTPLVQRMQRRIDAIHNAYAPYCQTDPRFEMTAASRHLGAKFRQPPIVDRSFLARMLDYAIENDWGSKMPSRP
jgi:nucleoside-diphosphate-sugar epimerase